MTDQIATKSDVQSFIDKMVRRLTINFAMMLSVAVAVIITAFYLTT